MRNHNAKYYFEDKWDNLVEWYRDHKLISHVGVIALGALIVGTIIRDNTTLSRRIAQNHQPELATATLLFNEGKIVEAYRTSRQTLYSMAQKRDDGDFSSDSIYQRVADSLTTITNNCQREARQRGITLSFNPGE